MINLTPVTDQHMKPDYPRWRYRRNVLGSILLWANRANAVKIEFNEDSPTPFRYFTSAGTEVETEMGQPPDNVRKDLFRTLILSTIKRSSPWRMLKQILFPSVFDKLSATFVASDPEFGDSTWTMESDGTCATFLKQENPYTAPRK
ncbi:MAG: hypothetical protein R3C20_24295 [Planctomycetaceae bacterium]